MDLTLLTSPELIHLNTQFASRDLAIRFLAGQLQQQGMTAAQAALRAARLRLRPILMTSMAFALGVLPLMLAQGASRETQQAIGTGVFGGMVTATVLAVFFVPVFYVVVDSSWRWLRPRLPVSRGSSGVGR